VVHAVYSTLLSTRDNYEALFEAPLPGTSNEISFTEIQRVNVESDVGDYVKRVQGATYAE
jgi:hypothetical protein